MTTYFRALLARARQKFRDYEIDAETPAPYEHRSLMSEIEAALSEPVGEVSDDEIDQLYREAHQYRPDARFHPEVIATARAFARLLLARYGTPRPVPVAVGERLPQLSKGDVDSSGRCWLFADTDDCCAYTHWLPHDAIPTPATTEEP